MEQKNHNKEKEEVVDFNLKEFIKICFNKWYWFFICAGFAVGVALFYIYRKEPVYERYEQILVNNEDAGGSVGEIASTFSSLGLFSKNTNVYNELLTLTSPAVLYEVADSLQLDMNYFEKDGLRAKTLYGTTLPFRIDMLDIDRQGGASFKIKREPDGSMEFLKFRMATPGGLVKFKEKVKVKPGETMVNTPIGRIQITPNPDYEVSDKDEESRTLFIGKMAMQNTVELYGSKLSGDLADQDADVIELSIKDVCVQRAVDILDYVLLVYNQNWVKDKNRMANATSKFIDERLKVIQAELGDVDKTIAEYMKKNGTPDMEATIVSTLGLNSKMEEQLILTSNDLSMARYMKDFLSNNNNITTVLPANLGMENRELNSQIVTYNDLLLSRNNVLSNSSPNNPLVQNYDRQLLELRAGIEKSVDNQISSLQQAKANIQSELGRMKSSMANAPEENLPLLSEERQQTVKAALYLYLLQKREENELTQKFSADNIRIITPPVGPLKPVSPRTGLIIIISLILGFGVPFVVLYYLETSNTTIRSKKDLEALSMPFMGEVPQVGEKVNLKKLSEKNPLKRKKEEKPPLAVVQEGKRDVVNEAFRVIRGNIDFMSGKNAGSQVIMLTSFNPGSGKSFITLNLARSFCLKGKKVLIIDCDLRHGSSSMTVGMPGKGLTSYLTGSTDNWESLVVKSTETPNLSVLPIGKIPPNPAELLEDGKIDTLVEEAKKEYDIIFLDCPPVNIVVDTQILAPLADRTLFVVRAGLLEKAALKELNEFYEEKKYKNISVILNGTEAIRSRYYTYGNYQHLG